MVEDCMKIIQFDNFFGSFQVLSVKSGIFVHAITLAMSMYLYETCLHLKIAYFMPQCDLVFLRQGQIIVLCQKFAQ